MADSRARPDRPRAWALVFLAAMFEVCWAVGLPWTEGFTNPVPTVLVVVAMFLSFLPLARATRTLPIGPAYAVWTGLGAGGTVAFASLLHGEPLTTLRMSGVVLVVAGVVGLRLFDGSDGVPRGRAA